jgi:hypothetical protein
MEQNKHNNSYAGTMQSDPEHGHSVMNIWRKDLGCIVSCGMAHQNVFQAYHVISQTWLTDLVLCAKLQVSTGRSRHENSKTALNWNVPRNPLGLKVRTAAHLASLQISADKTSVISNGPGCKCTSLTELDGNHPVM